MGGPQEQAPRSGDAIRLRIKPLSDFYDEKDPRYASEAFELQRALGHELPDGLEVHPATGEKGVAVDLIVNITTAGGIAGIVEVIKAWLATRPVHRKIDLEFEVDERKGKRTGKLRIDASNVDSQHLDEITGDAFKSGD